MKKKITVIIILLMTTMILSGCITGQARGKKGPTAQCNDGIDNDNDGLIDFEGLYEGKGKNRILVANPDNGCNSKEDNTECDSSPETCDGIDNDCDGEVDEELGSTTCGTGVCQNTAQNCVNAVPQICIENPSTTETCNNLDDDCDGLIDETLNEQCGISNVGECQYGVKVCSTGFWGTCNGNIDPITETCDGKDNDCDGTIDEGCNCINGQTTTCGTNTGQCQTGTQTCTNGNWGTCNNETTPSLETCDGQDNNCDGTIDENLPIVCSQTSDCGTDGYNGNNFCGTDGNIYRNYSTYSCFSINTCNSECSTDTGAIIQENCFGLGCSNGVCNSPSNSTNQTG